MEKENYDINYIPKSMSFSAGFMGPMGDVGFMMKLDRDKAKKIIKSIIKEKHKIINAEVGLDGDFHQNSMEIFDGKDFQDTDSLFDSSIWAEPILMVYFKDQPSRKYSFWKKKDD